MKKHEFTFMQGGQMFAAIVVLIIVAVVLFAANPEVLKDLLPSDDKTGQLNQPPIYAPLPASKPTPARFTHELTKDQFVPDHHQLVCNTQGIECSFGIYDAAIESFYMGMDKTIVSYNENTMTVFPHVSEGDLEVGQIYAECTLSTYTLTVNGATFLGCFEGTFLGVDESGYHFLSNGQPMNLPHTHGAFLTPHSH